MNTPKMIDLRTREPGTSEERTNAAKFLRDKLAAKVFQDPCVFCWKGELPLVWISGLLTFKIFYMQKKI